MLAGREVRAVEIAGSDAVGLEVSIDPGELPAAWREARALVADTGRWPLAVDYAGEGVYSRFYYRSEEENPNVVLELADAMTLEQALWGIDDSALKEYVTSDWARIVGLELDETRGRVGDAPTEQDVDHAVPLPDEPALERYLLEWEESRCPTSQPEKPELHEPSYAYEACRTLAFLPTAHGADAPAYTSFVNAGHYGHERLVVALRHWQTVYAAEVVANSGTIIVLQIGRPPRLIDEAWQVVIELERLTDHWDSSRRERTRATLDNPVWTLISRP